jgi:hypothetical protein
LDTRKLRSDCIEEYVVLVRVRYVDS